MSTNGNRDLISMIREQHETIRELFAEVQRCDAGNREEAFQPLVRLLAVHETAEEEIVYPAIRKVGQVGITVAEERKTEEDKAKKTLAELEGMDASSTEFKTELSAFQLDVDQHARNEEMFVLPLLAQSDHEQLQSMSKMFAVAEAMAPTHAHRMAPESAVGNMMVGPFVALVDRVRDAIRDARH
jgi:hemerythrin superfamily protein